MKTSVQRFGKFLSSMVMPNIGAFIAWGFLTALFIPAGWFPNEQLASMVDPIIKYLLPLLIGYQGGKIVGGDRGAVCGAIATMGVVCGAEQNMLIGAMLMGPVGGLCIKHFDRATSEKVPAGFEMLVNNFSVGLIGMGLAIFGYYLVGPVMASILAVLSTGVAFLIDHTLLPLAALLVEPAKVLFLNNAINHGIFTPLGAEQAAVTGKSIMYMLESNPGPGLGVLLAYWAFAKDEATKSSAPGAVIIHFFGGIHEIYFPYVLMNPIVLVAPMAASVCALFYYSILGAGLVGPASPGSIIAYLAVAPNGETLLVLGGVVLATIVSFLVASPIVKMASPKDLAAATAQVKASKPGAATASLSGDVHKIIFACDAGMGSSAMGATKFRKRIAPLNLGIHVSNTSVDNVPADADIVVCQEILQDRAKKSAPQATCITIGNFLNDPALDGLYAQLANQNVAPVVETPAVETPTEAAPAGDSVLVREGILLGLAATSKEDAIQKAGEQLHALGYVDAGYIPAMLDRERTVTTYMGLGVAIPHGTSQAKGEVKKTGIVLLQYPNGVDFGDEDAQLVFGIAGIGEEHLDLLVKIGELMEDEDKLDFVKTSTDVDAILALLS